MKIERPFVHLLRSPNGWYFFDVNRNEIVATSAEVYRALEGLLKGAGEEDLPAEVVEELHNIRAMGYLSNKRVKTIRHSATDSLEQYLRNNMSTITLQLTQNCNFRCSYCVYSELSNTGQRAHSAKCMSWETAKAALDFLLAHSRDSEEVSVGFYGGEPLLEMELLKQSVLYAEEMFEGKTLFFNMTTNGSLLTEEITRFLVEHNIKVMVSIDGPKEIHDINRRFAANGKGSFDVVRRNLERIAREYPAFFREMIVSMVVDPQNDYDRIRSLYDDGSVFREVTVHSSVIDDVYSLEKTVYSHDYISKRDYEIFLAYLAHFGRLDPAACSPMAREEVGSMLSRLQNMTGSAELPDETSHGGPCIPGKNRLLVTVDGAFYPCERVSESSPALRLGDLKHGFDYEQARRVLNIAALTADRCRECWALSLCNQCAKHADNGGELSGDFKQSFCDGTLKNARRELEYILMLKEIPAIYQKEEKAERSVG